MIELSTVLQYNLSLSKFLGALYFLDYPRGSGVDSSAWDLKALGQVEVVPFERGESNRFRG